MASSSPLKLTVEEQVPFTPPRSLTRSFPGPPSSGELNRSGSIETSSFSSTPGDEDDFENHQENIQINNTSIIRGLRGGKKGRRRGCGQCQGCRSQDCGKCKMCKDKVKFGGRGVKKQKCLFRKCCGLVKGPSLPAAPNKKRERNDESVIDSSSPVTSARKRRCTAHYRISSSSSESSNQSDSCVILATEQPPTSNNTEPPPLINKIFNPPAGLGKNWLSPFKDSPLKTGSSPRKKNSLFGKEQESSLPSKQSIPIDTAPFNGLLHVRQVDTEEGLCHYSILDKLILIPGRKLIPIPSTNSLSLGSITEAVTCITKEKKKIENVIHNDKEVLLSEGGLELFKRYQTLSKTLPCSPSGCCLHDNHMPPLNVSVHILNERRGGKIKVDFRHYGRSKRQSKRLRMKEDKEVSLDTAPTTAGGEERVSTTAGEERVSSRIGHDLWTSYYQPRSSREVVGNERSVSLLLNWLTQWKDTCLGKSPSLNDSICSSLLSEDGSPPSLPPAMIISGATGAGKTACVYACAQELGYRVLEINTTHTRNRHGIISMLREATLSHQVAITGKSANMREPHPPAPPPPNKKGILSFFTQKAPVKPQPQKYESSTLPKQEERALTLETASLVLIEEVDLLFEDEVRGLWLGLYDILATSKRPIILTTNEIGLKLDTLYESINMATPSKDEVSLHAQLLSMSHDYHMTTEVANQITVSLDSDIRKVFSTLHFWLAGHTLSNQPVKLDNVIKKKPYDPITSMVFDSPPVAGCPSMYHELDEAVMWTDGLSAADICNGRITGTSSEWWACKTKDSLSEELSQIDTSLNMEEWESVLSSSMGMRGSSTGMRTGCIGTLSGRNEDEFEIQSLRRNVSLDVFHVRTVLSRQSLATDCLPVLHLICKYENDRKLAKTSRRFSHYLMQNNLDHLQQFLYSNTLSSTHTQ